MALGSLAKADRGQGSKGQAGRRARCAERDQNGVASAQRRAGSRLLDGRSSTAVTAGCRCWKVSYQGVGAASQSLHPSVSPLQSHTHPTGLAMPSVHPQRATLPQGSRDRAECSGELFQACLLQAYFQRRSRGCWWCLQPYTGPHHGADFSERCRLLKTSARLWDAREGTCVHTGVGSTPAEEAEHSACAAGLLCLFSWLFTSTFRSRSSPQASPSPSATSGRRDTLAEGLDSTDGLS